jgi:ribose transport system permease protein
VNGIGIAVLGVPPLVATLALASVVDGGLIVFVSAQQPSNAASPLLVGIAGRARGGLPNVVLLWALVAVAAVWMLARSAWGRRLAGTGANPIVALLSGTSTTRVRIGAYGLSGGIAALTGFLLTAMSGKPSSD